MENSAVKAIGILFVTCASMIGPARAAPALSDEGPTVLLAEWARLDSACRGGHGNEPATQAACDERAKLDGQLKAAGWCYGRIGEAQYQKSWRRCAADSLR